MATKVTAPDAATAATPDTAPAPRRRGPSLNRVSLIGRLTADPKLRYTPNGTAVASFRIANNGTYEVQYHDIVAWRGLAEIAAEHLTKGRLVYLSGRLHSRSWTGQDGLGRWALEIIADDIQFLTPKPYAAPAAAAA
ncbi:MAG TPA: single-stranded DNA-binding protein [Chloroflexi bacterium]|nr:single-stranded DNA-binding protein [Chloroflexota bacterium]